MEQVLDMSLSQIAEDHPLQPSPPSYTLFSKQFFLLHGRHLLACSAAWFFLDIVFYSGNLCQSHIFESRHNTSEAIPAFEVARLQAILACCCTIPGYFAAVFLIDRVGRVRIQMVGFVLMAVVYFSMICVYWRHRTGTLFVIQFGLTFFLANCGPNTTTFILPAELFPARFRSTCHGIAGAAGKVGAMIGAVVFSVVTKDDDQSGNNSRLGMEIMLLILGGICLLGMAVTMLFTRETMGTSLEENEETVQPKCFP